MRTLRNRTNNRIEITESIILVPKSKINISDDAFKTHKLLIKKYIIKRLIDDLGNLVYTPEHQEKPNQKVPDRFFNKVLTKKEVYTNEQEILITKDKKDEKMKEPNWYNMNKKQYIAFAIGEDLEIENLSRGQHESALRNSVRKAWRKKNNE